VRAPRKGIEDRECGNELRVDVYQLFEWLETVRDERHDVVGDGGDREALDRLLETQLKLASMIDRGEQPLVLLFARDVDSRAEQRERARSLDTGGERSRRRAAVPTLSIAGAMRRPRKPESVLMSRCASRGAP